MQKHEDNLASRINGNALQPLSGVTVTVVDDATGLPAALYSDDGVTLITDPIVTNDNGGYSFYAADGKYTITFTSVRLATPVTRKLILEDPDDNPAASLAQLAAAGGGALVSTLASGTGAVVRSLASKAADFVNVKDYGAVVGAADNLTAIQKALDASLHVDFGGPSDTFTVLGTLTLRNGHVLRGMGGTITQGTANAEIFNIEGKSDITASGLKLVGTGGYTDSDSARTVGFYGGTSGARIHITRCHFYNFGYTPARFKAQTNCSFTFNTVEGPGSPTLTAITSGKNYGVLFDSGCQGALVYGNDISKCAQGVILNEVRDVRIEGNRLYDITGQHGIYAGAGLLNVVIANNVIYNTDLIGIKVQAQEYAAVDNINISITGNTIYDCGDQGILVCNGIAAPVYKCRNVSITGNSVRLTSGSGINVNNTIGGVVTGNTIDLAAFSGINLNESSWLKIDGNLITRSGKSAIRDQVACTSVDITNNKIVDCATALSGGDQYGIFLQFGSDYNIARNRISDSAAKMVYGIWLAGIPNDTVNLDHNIVADSTSGGLRLTSTAALRSNQGNSWAGTSGATLNDPVLPDVASAATIIIPQNHNAVTISGTTTITSITAKGHSGRVVVLVFTSTAGLTDGGNLKLASSFAGTADDTVTLACNGTNWYEVARSVN